MVETMLDPSIRLPTLEEVMTETRDRTRLEEVMQETRDGTRPTAAATVQQSQDVVPPEAEEHPVHREKKRRCTGKTHAVFTARV